jgi:hypothetical protein
MSPSGGVITVVDQPMMWSPLNRAFSSFSAKQTWLEVWPGVAWPRSVQPGPEASRRRRVRHRAEAAVGAFLQTGVGLAMVGGAARP